MPSIKPKTIESRFVRSIDVMDALLHQMPMYGCPVHNRGYDGPPGRCYRYLHKNPYNGALVIIHARFGAYGKRFFVSEVRTWNPNF